MTATPGASFKNILRGLLLTALVSIFAPKSISKDLEDPPSGSYYTLLALSSGYSRLHDKESVFLGFHSHTSTLRMVNSGYFKYFVFDWAMGVDFSSLLQGALETLNRRGGMGAVFEISGRWRFGTYGNWQIGPLFRLVVSEDPTYALAEAAEQYFLLSVGPQFIYDIPFHKRYLFRLGMNATVDLNVPTRRIFAFNIEGQIGTRSRYYSEATGLEEDGYQKENLLPEDQTEEDLDFVKLTLQSELLRFGPAQTELNTQIRRYLYSIAYFLSSNPKAWQWVEVHGHSDTTGTDYGNYKLSQQRAFAVRNGLVEAGVPARKIRLVAKGATEPLVTNALDNEAHQVNRRVELIFRGVEDEGFFRRGLRTARMRLQNQPKPAN